MKDFQVGNKYVIIPTFITELHNTNRYFDRNNGGGGGESEIFYWPHNHYLFRIQSQNEQVLNLYYILYFSNGSQILVLMTLVNKTSTGTNLTRLDNLDICLSTFTTVWIRRNSVNNPRRNRGLFAF